MRPRHSIRLSIITEQVLRAEAARTGKPLATIASEALDRAVSRRKQDADASPAGGVNAADFDRVVAEVAALRELVAALRDELEQADERAKNRFGNVLKAIKEARQ